MQSTGTKKKSSATGGGLEEFGYSVQAQPIGLTCMTVLLVGEELPKLGETMEAEAEGQGGKLKALAPHPSF